MEEKQEQPGSPQNQVPPSTTPESFDFLGTMYSTTQDFIKNGGNPEAVPSYSILGNMKSAEADGNTYYMPDRETARKKYKDAFPADQFDRFYDNYNGMYNSFRSNFETLNPGGGTAKSPYHWTNMPNYRGYRELPSDKMSNPFDAIIPNNDITGSGNTPMWSDEERARSKGMFINQFGQLQQAADADLDPSVMTVSYYNTADGRTIPYLRELPHVNTGSKEDPDIFFKERFGSTNIPIGSNWNEREAGYAENLYHAIPGSLRKIAPGMADMFLSSVDFLDRFIAGDPEIGLSFKDGSAERAAKIKSIVKDANLSPEALDLIKRVKTKSEIAALVELTKGDYEKPEDNPAWELLKLAEAYDFTEDALFDEMSTTRLAMNTINFNVEAKKYNSAREFTDHGFTGGPSGFHVGKFASNVIVGATEFLVPQMLTGAGVSRLALNIPKLYSAVGIGQKILTPLGRNVVRAAASSQMALQMGGLMRHEAIKLGLTDNQAYAMAVASLPVTFFTEYMIGANWMPKMFGNTYYQKMLTRDIAETIQLIAKEKGYILKNLTDSELETLGREAGQRVGKGMLGSKYSSKAGLDAIAAGEATADAGWPWAFRLMRNFNEKMPGWGQGAVTEGAQEGLEFIGHSFEQEIFDKHFASEGSTKGMGMYGTDIFSNEWNNEFYENVIGGVGMGALGGAFVKNRRVINETLFGFIADGKKDDAIAVVNQMRQAQSFGPNHVNIAGETITEATEDKVGLNDALADLMIKDIEMISEIAESYKIKDKLDEQGIKDLFSGTDQGYFALLKQGLQFKVQEQLITAQLEELEKNNDKSSPDYDDKITKVKIALENIKNNYKDIVNGNMARDMGLAIYANQNGLMSSKLIGAKLTHKMAFENYSAAKAAHDLMMDETKEKRTQFSAKIAEIIKGVDGIMANMDSAQSVYDQILEVAGTKFDKGETDAASIDNLQGALNKSFSDQEASMGQDAMLDHMGKGTPMGKILDFGGMSKGKTNKGLQGMQQGIAPEGPVLSQFVNDEYAKILRTNSGDYIDIPQRLADMFNLIEVGQIGNYDLENITAIIAHLNLKLELAEVSFKNLNKAPEKYAFRYAQTDTSLNRDAGPSKLTQDQLDQIGSDIKEHLTLASEILDMLKRADKIRQSRSNRYMIDNTVIELSGINKVMEVLGDNVGQPSKDLLNDIVKQIEDFKGDLEAQDQLKFDKIFEDITSLKGQLFEAMNSKDVDINGTISKVLDGIYQVFDFSASELKNKTIDISYSTGNVMDDINLAAKIVGFAQTGNKALIPVSQNNYNTGKYVYAKVVKDLLISISRADARYVRKAIMHNVHPEGQSLNYQQELAIFQLYGWNKSMRSNRQGVPFHVSGYAGTGKTTVIIKNLIQIIAREKNSKVNITVVAPSTTNLNSFEESLKIDGKSDTFNLQKITTHNYLTLKTLPETSKNSDIIIIDESHILGSSDKIDNALSKSNKIPTVMMGDNRQLPSPDGKGTMQKSFEIHPAYSISERTISLYEMYRSGNGEIIKLQDSIGKHIEGSKPINGKKAFWEVEAGKEFLFNEAAGVEFLQSDVKNNKKEVYTAFAEFIVDEVIAGMPATNSIFVSINKDNNVSAIESIKAIIESKTGIALNPTQEKVLFDKVYTLDMETPGGSQSILGGSAEVVFVGNLNNEFSDPVFYSRYLLTASTRSSGKVVIPTSNTATFASNRKSSAMDPLATGSAGDVARQKEWMDSLTRQPAPGTKTAAKPVKPMAKPGTSQKYSIGDTLEKDGVKYVISGIKTDGSFVVNEVKNDGTLGHDLIKIAEDIQIQFKDFSDGEKKYSIRQGDPTKPGSVNYNAEFAANNWWMSNMTTYHASSLEDMAKEKGKLSPYLKAVEIIENSDFYKTIVDGLNKLDQDARTNILTGRGNSVASEKEHAFNEVLRALRYELLNNAPIGSEVKFFTGNGRNYSSGRPAVGTIEAELVMSPSISRFFRTSLFSNVLGVSNISGDLAQAMFEALNLAHIGNLPDAMTIAQDENDVGYPQEYNDVIAGIKAQLESKTTPGARMLIGNGRLHKPESFDGNYSSHVISMMMAARKKDEAKISMSTFILQLQAMGQELEMDNVSMDVFPVDGKMKAEYNVKIVRKNISGKIVQGQTVRIFPKNIIEQDKEIAEMHLDFILNNTSEGSIFNDLAFNFINFNKATLKKAVLQDPEGDLAKSLNKYLNISSSKRKGVSDEFRGKIAGKPDYSKDKEKQEVRSFISELKQMLPKLKDKGIPLFAALDINITSIDLNQQSNDATLRFKHLDLLEIDRDFGKHHLTWFKIQKLGSKDASAPAAQAPDAPAAAPEEANGNPPIVVVDEQGSVTIPFAPEGQLAVDEVIEVTEEGVQDTEAVTEEVSATEPEVTETPTTEEDNTEDDDDFSDVSFDDTLNDANGDIGKTASMKWGERIISNILGEEYAKNGLSFVPQTSLPDGRVLYGVLRNGLMSIHYNQQGDINQKTPRHEAMHQIMLNLMSPEAYASVMAEIEYRARLTGEMIPKTKYDKEVFLLEYAADLYAETYDLGIFDKIPGIIGDFIRFLHGTFRGFFANMNELDMLMAEAETGEWSRVRENAVSNFTGSLNMAKQKTVTFKSLEAAEDTMRQVTVNIEGNQVLQPLDKEDRRIELDKLIINTNDVKQSIFGGSEFAYKYAESILKDMLIGNSPLSTTFTQEILRGKLADSSINKQVFQTFKQAVNFGARYEKEIVPITIGTTTFGKLSEVIGSDKLKNFDLRDNSDMVKHMDTLRKISVMALSDPGVFVRMVSGLYNIDIERAVAAISGKAQYDKSIEQEVAEREAMEELFGNDQELQEQGDNAVYKQARTVNPIDRTSKLLKFILSSIPVLSVSNHPRFSRISSDSTQDGQITIEAKSSFVKERMVSNLFSDMTQNFSQKYEDNPDAFRSAMLDQISAMPDGDSKDQAISIYYRVFDNYGIMSDMNGGKTPVFSYYALMTLEPSEIWRQLKLHQSYVSGVSIEEVTDVFYNENRVLTEEMFMSMIEEKKLRATDVYNATVTYLKNIKHQAHAVVYVAERDGKRIINIRNYGFSSEEGYSADLRRNLESKLEEKPSDPNEQYMIDTGSITFMTEAEYNKVRTNSAFFSKKVLINEKGIFMIKGAGQKVGNYIPIIDFNEDGTFAFSKTTGSLANSLQYGRSIMQAFGLKGQFVRQDVFNYFVRGNKELMDKNYIPNLLGMYAALMHNGIQSSAGMTKDDLSSQWSHKYLKGPKGADKMFTPMDNEYGDAETNTFTWPTDMAEANKYLAAIIVSNNGVGFDKIIKSVDGKWMQTQENGNAINKYLSPRISRKYVDVNGDIKDQDIPAGMYFALATKRAIMNGKIIRSKGLIDPNEYPNSFINPIPETGLLDEVIDIFDGNGMAGPYGKKIKDKNMSSHDEMSSITMHFWNALRSQSSKTKDLEYVVPISQHGDHETFYARVKIAGDPILHPTGVLNKKAISVRIREIFRLRMLESTDSMNKWVNFMASNGFVDPNQAAKLAPMKVNGTQMIPAEAFQNIIGKFGILPQEQANRDAFYAAVRASDLVEGLDYTVTNGPDGKQIGFGRAFEMNHEIFSVENSSKILGAKSDAELTDAVDETMMKFVRHFAYMLDGKDQRGREIDNSINFQQPAEWAKKFGYIITEKRAVSTSKKTGEAIVKDGKTKTFREKMIVNPYIEGMYYAQFIASHQINSSISNTPYAYKDAIEKQKRISQRVTPVIIPTDAQNIIGGIIKTITFEDIKADRDYITGIGTVIRAKDISETDGYAIMNPLFHFALKRAFGGTAGILPDGHLKMLLYNSGKNYKASWATITDSVLYLADMNDPDGFNPWNIIIKTFINRADGIAFAEELHAALEAARDMPLKDKSIIDIISKKWYDNAVASNIKISDIVAGFAASTESVKSLKSNIVNLNDQDWSGSFVDESLFSFGMINDPSQDIDDDPTASSNIQQATQMAWATAEEVGEFKTIWSAIINAQHKQRNVSIEDIKNRAIVMGDKSNVSGNTLMMFTDPKISLNTPGLSDAINSAHMSYVNRSMVRFRTAGARMTQAPAKWFKITDENGNDRKLRPVRFDPEKGVVEAGEVVMPGLYLNTFIPKKELALMGKFITPEMVMNYITDEESKMAFQKMLTVVASRIPSGGPNSGFVMNIVGFVNDNANTIYLPSAVNVLNGADYDIDQLQVWSYKPTVVQSPQGRKTVVHSGDPNNEEEKASSLINALLDATIRIYMNPDNMKFTGSTTSLDIPNKIKDHFANASGRGRINSLKWITRDDLTGHLVRKGIVSQGSAAIGKIANLSKSVSLLVAAEKINPGSALKMGISQYSIQEIDKWLNSALDNEKHFILGMLNIHPNMLDFVIAYVAKNFDPNKAYTISPDGTKQETMVGAGHTFLEIGDIMNTQIMRQVLVDMNEINYAAPNSKFLEDDTNKSILGNEMKLYELLELQKKRIANGNFLVDRQTLLSKLPEGVVGLIKLQDGQKPAEIDPMVSQHISEQMAIAMVAAKQEMLNQIEDFKKYAAFGEALSRIGFAAPLTSIPKTHNDINRYMFNLSAMLNYDVVEYLDTGVKNIGTGVEDQFMMRPYMPMYTQDQREFEWFLEKENTIRSMVDFDALFETDPVLKSIVNVLHQEHKKEKEVFTLDMNPMITAAAQKFYNTKMVKRGFQSERITDEFNNMLHKYIMSIYFTANGDKIAIPNQSQRILDLENPDIDDGFTGQDINLSHLNLTTYEGRQAYISIFPLWLESKIAEYKLLGEEQAIAVESNLFRQYVRISDQSGLTMYRIENMGVVSNIQAELKQDTNKLFDMIDPTGGALQAARTYHMILNGFSYGKGSMSILFETKEFYDFSEWMESTITPALTQPDNKMIQIGRMSYSMNDLINNDIFTQMSGVLINDLPRKPEKEPGSKMPSTVVVSGWEKNPYMDKNQQAIIMREGVKYSGSFDMKFDAWRATNEATVKDSGVYKIKTQGMSDLMNYKYRKLGYNVAILPSSVERNSLNHDAFTDKRTLKSAGAKVYVEILNSGTASIFVPQAVNKELIGSEAYLDGTPVIITDKSSLGEMPMLYLSISNKAFKKMNISEEDITPENANSDGDPLTNKCKD